MCETQVEISKINDKSFAFWVRFEFDSLDIFFTIDCSLIKQSLCAPIDKKKIADNAAGKEREDRS